MRLLCLSAFQADMTVLKNVWIGNVCKKLWTAHFLEVDLLELRIFRVGQRS
jgi:hypothetical protein